MAVAGREARLTLKLLDRVTRPANAIVGALGRVNAATRAMTSMALAPTRALSNAARGMRRAAGDSAILSGSITLGLARAGRAVYDFEKAANRMQAFGLLGGDQRKDLERYAQVLNREFPFTNRQILEAAQELFRAGLTYEQAIGALRGSLQLALAGDIEIAAATDIATNVMTAMKLPMETLEQVEDSLGRVNDALAYAATNSNTDVRLMGDTFRYVAPLAAAAGMELEEVTAISMELARAGIKGSEAGVAMRSALVRMAKPTKPMLAAFERLGLSMDSFVKYRKRIEAGSITGSLLASGIEADHLAGEIQSILDNPELAAAPARLTARLTDLIVGAMGDETLRSEVAEVLSDAVYAGAQQVDLIGLLGTLRDKGATLGDIANIFDVRMGSRLAAILHNDLVGAVDKVHAEYRGVGQQMAGLMMQGIVGSVARIVAAMENFAIRLADAGVMDTIGNFLDRASAALARFAAVNPRLLELGTYGAMAVAAIAPLGFAVSGMASALAFAANPLTLVAGGIIALAGVHYGPLMWFFRGLGNVFRNNLNPRVVDGVAQGLDRIRRWWRGMRGFGADGEAWARAARQWGEGLANAVNRIYASLERMGSSEFLNRFGEGLVIAFDRVGWAAGRLGDGIAFVLEKFEALAAWGEASGLTGTFGRVLGEIAGYSLALGVAAIGLGLVARPLRAIGRALAVLSGIKLAWGVTRFIARLALLAGSAAAVGALAASIRSLAGATDAVNKSAGGGGRSRGQARQPGRFGRLGGALMGALGGKWTLGAIAAWTAGEVGMSRYGRGPDSEGYDDRAREDVMRAQKDRLQGELLDATEGWSQAATRSMFEYVSALAAGGDNAEAEAARIGRQIEHELNVTGHPDVNTDRLERALAMARQLSEAIRALGSGPGRTPVAPQSAPARRFGGARRRGGPVEKGLTYAVGEEGVELFTAERSGRIIPNSKLGGGGSVTVHVGGIKVFGGDGEKVARDFVNALDRALLRSRQVGIDGRAIAEG